MTHHAWFSGCGPRRPRRTDAAIYAGLVAACLALKQFYTTASAEQLRFVLAPTAKLVELLTGAAFPFEAGVGFVNLGYNTAIVPGCAGLNFLIVGWATLVIGFLARFPSTARKTAFVITALATAFAATVAVNAGRIALDIGVRDVALAIDRAHVHRWIGVGMYLGSACLLYAIGDRATRRGAA